MLYRLRWSCGVGCGGGKVVDKKKKKKKTRRGIEDAAERRVEEVLGQVE